MESLSLRSSLVREKGERKSIESRYLKTIHQKRLGLKMLMYLEVTYRKLAGMRHVIPFQKLQSFFSF